MEPCSTAGTRDDSLFTIQKAWILEIKPSRKHSNLEMGRLCRIHSQAGPEPEPERFASKYAFAKLTIDVFNTVLAALNQKATHPTDNKYVFICNERFWYLLQAVLGDYLAKFKTVGTYLFSKQANGYVQVGATFQTYEFGGNQISFKVDRTFSREYGFDKGYCLCLDLTADATSAEPPI